jgi:hypothetical protein
MKTKDLIAEAISLPVGRKVLGDIDELVNCKTVQYTPTY